MSQVELTIASNNIDATTFRSESLNVQIQENSDGIKFTSSDSEMTAYVGDLLMQYVGKRVNLTIKNDNGPRRRAIGWVVQTLGLPFISYKKIEEAPAVNEQAAPVKSSSTITNAPISPVQAPKADPIDTVPTPSETPAPADETIVPAETGTQANDAAADDAGDGTTPQFGGGGSEGSW